ncbi:MAG TPA: hypothetical protein VGL24_02985 [Chthoniobacterales bacterium]|jgi:uncharacterized protein YerC
MFKSALGLAFTLCLVVGCAAPQPAGAPQAAAGHPQSTAVASVDSASANQQEYDTVFVPPPVGSLLGGGSVRVPKKYNGVDEQALNGNIRSLNAAAGSKDERPFVVTAVSRATGVSTQTLQAQQDLLRLRFGELCAINAIARGNTAKAREIAGLRSQGRSWTDLAKANGLSVATVAQVTRSASEMTANDYSNAADRQKGGQRKLKDMGVRPGQRPGN